MKTVSVPSRLWHENVERVLSFPDRWQVEDLTSPGFDKPALSAREILDRIEHVLKSPLSRALTLHSPPARFSTGSSTPSRGPASGSSPGGRSRRSSCSTT